MRLTGLPSEDLPALSRHPRTREVLPRVLRNCCPFCGEGELFSGLFRQRHHCERCGYRFERGRSYLLASVLVAFGGASFLLGTLALAAHEAVAWSLSTIGIVLLPLDLVLTLAFLRYARGFWMGVDHLTQTLRPQDFERAVPRSVEDPGEPPPSTPTANIIPYNPNRWRPPMVPRHDAEQPPPREREAATEPDDAPRCESAARRRDIAVR